MGTTHIDLDSMNSLAGPRPGSSLVDLATGGFILVFNIQSGNDPGHPDDLRVHIASLFEDMEKLGQRYGHAQEDIKAVRYALCALIDETILNSRWAFREQWADRPLQLQYFGEQLAGERLFDLLTRIRQKGRRKADLLEVFCITLIIGFQGKYKMSGQQERAELIHDLVKEVEGYREVLSRGLSPHGVIPEEDVEEPARGIPRWAWITALVSLGSVVVCYIVFALWLGSTLSDALRRIA